MALMYLRSCYNVKASMVLIKADHLFLHNYKRALLNSTLIPINDPYEALTRFILPVCHIYIYIYIYIYIFL